MKFKTLMIATVMVAAPGLASAYECNWSKPEQVTMSCAPGTTFDAGSNTCIATGTS